MRDTIFAFLVPLPLANSMFIRPSKPNAPASAKQPRNHRVRCFCREKMKPTPEMTEIMLGAPGGAPRSCDPRLTLLMVVQMTFFGRPAQ